MKPCPLGSYSTRKSIDTYGSTAPPGRKQRLNSRSVPFIPHGRMTPAVYRLARKHFQDGPVSPLETESLIRDRDSGAVHTEVEPPFACPQGKHLEEAVVVRTLTAESDPVSRCFAQTVGSIKAGNGLALAQGRRLGNQTGGMSLLNDACSRLVTSYKRTP